MLNVCGGVLRTTARELHQLGHSRYTERIGWKTDIDQKERKACILLQVFHRTMSYKGGNLQIIMNVIVEVS